MNRIELKINDDKTQTVVTPQPLVEGENLTTEIALIGFPAAWAGSAIRALITTPKGMLVDAVDASEPVGLTNTMLDGKGTLYVEFAAMKGGTEIARTVSPALLPVSAARSLIGEIDPAPLPDLVAEMVAAKNTALDAASSCEATDAEVKAAEGLRVTAESSRVGVEGLRVTAEQGRVTAESARGQNEIGRVNAELERAGAEAERALTESAVKISYGNRYIRSLAARLATGILPACILCQGDSTSAGVAHWYYKTVEWIKTLYPNYTVKYRLWNNATDAYGDQEVLQTGSGGDAYVLFPNAAGRHISAPDTVPLSVTGDIDIRAKVRITDKTTGVLPSIISKTQYWLTVSSLASGRLTLYWYNSTFVLKSATSEPTSILSGSDYWMRATLDVDNGAGGYDVKFWTSADGVTWTQIGTTITGTATTDIYNGTNAVEIGSTGAGTGGYWGGRFYYAEIRSGISGKIVGCFDAGLAFPSLTKTVADAEGNAWTINGSATNGLGSPLLLALNGSVPGTVIALANLKLAAQTKIAPHLLLIAYGHNETTKVEYQANCETHAASIAAAFPDCGIVFSTQNPQKPSDINEYCYPVQHAIRTAQTAQAAAKGNYGLIDGYRAFMETPSWQDLVNADGVHPTDAGQLVWADAAKKFMLAL